MISGTLIACMEKFLKIFIVMKSYPMSYKNQWKYIFWRDEGFLFGMNWNVEVEKSLPDQNSASGVFDFC